MIQLKVYQSVADQQANLNPVFLDLYDVEPIKLTLSIEDITNADASSVFSKQFKVPASRNNNEFFLNAFEIDGIDFDVTTKKPAEILVDGSLHHMQLTNNQEALLLTHRILKKYGKQHQVI